MAVILSIGCAVCMTSCNGSSGKYTVGIIQLAPHPALDSATQGFKDALVAELGEENVSFLFQNAQGEATTCTTIVNDFVTKNVDLIMANATAALQAASNATDDIPVVGTSITAYGVALKLDNFTGTVGTNVTGASDLANLEEQANMVKLFPGTETVALLYCSAEPNSDYQVKEVKKYLDNMGYTTELFPFSDSNDVAAVATAAAAKDVIYIPTDNTAAICAGAIYGAIGDTPVIAGEEAICKGCGVVTLTISYYDMGYVAGQMAAKILKGEAEPETMPIEIVPDAKQIKKYNATRCAELNIDVAALEASGFVAIEGTEVQG